VLSGSCISYLVLLQRPSLCHPSRNVPSMSPDLLMEVACIIVLASEPLLRSFTSFQLIPSVRQWICRRSQHINVCPVVALPGTSFTGLQGYQHQWAVAQAAAISMLSLYLLSALTPLFQKCTALVNEPSPGGPVS